MGWREHIPERPLVRRGKLGKLSALSGSEWRTLITAAVLLPAIAVALRILGYRRTHAWMARQAHKRRRSENAACEVALVCRMVSVAASHGVYRANCLRQALAAWWLLERCGVASKLVIGVRKDEQGFAAHAWVEYQGQVVIGGNDAPQRFQAMTPVIETEPDESRQPEAESRQQP